MYTMKKALKNKRFGAVLAWLFALFAVIASFGIGNMTQGNSISGALHTTFHVPTHLTGIVITVLALLIIVGGIKSISKVSSVDNDREPSWCVFCDAKDRCDSCDATDSDDNDCGSCDFGTECTHIG